MTGTGNPLLICTKMHIYTPCGGILWRLSQKHSSLVVEEKTPTILIWILNINKRNYFKHNLLKNFLRNLKHMKKTKLDQYRFFFLMYKKRKSTTAGPEICDKQFGNSCDNYKSIPITYCMYSCLSLIPWLQEIVKRYKTCWNASYF